MGEACWILRRLDHQDGSEDVRVMPAEFILVDISNSFTKVAFSSRERLGRSFRLPTSELTIASFHKMLRGQEARFAVVASVVPPRNHVVRKALPQPICWVSHKIPLGVGVDYPKPETIGADRLANAVAAATLYGSPSIVVDFGTAVTFDVISPHGTYVGGVIAPGLGRDDRRLAQADGASAACEAAGASSRHWPQYRGGHARRGRLWVSRSCLRNSATASEGNSLQASDEPDCHWWRCEAHRREHRHFLRGCACSYSGGTSPYWMSKFPRSKLAFGCSASNERATA